MLLSGFYNFSSDSDHICRRTIYFHRPAAFCDPRLIGSEGGGRCVVFAIIVETARRETFAPFLFQDGVAVRMLPL